MTETVHILATCKNVSLLPATLLVFDSLRTGFPAARVFVWGNSLRPEADRHVRQACEHVRATYQAIPHEIAHDHWIENLLSAAVDPFWICDTDIVFWKSVEGWFGWSTHLAGRYEPAFTEPWSGTQKSERLHTSLMWLSPKGIRLETRNWLAKWHPKHFPFRPETLFIRQQFIPQGLDKPPIFSDTTAALYAAIGGTKFTDEQNEAFDHLHCGIYSDRIAAALPGIQEVHRAVFQNPEAARGLYAQQSAFYQDHGLTR